MDETRERTAVIRELTATEARLDVSGQTLTWPAAAVPAGAKKGDQVRLRLMTEQEATSDRHELARAIITEIIGGRS